METLDALDHIAINDILCRFFLAFDERDWTAMEKCLAPEVFIDYSSSGREQARVMSGVESGKCLFACARRSWRDPAGGTGKTVCPLNR